MSDNAILEAIDWIGYKGDMSGHGFRALQMSTIKDRLRYCHEVVDRQLAHVYKDKVTRAYDRAEVLEERRRMMQGKASAGAIVLVAEEVALIECADEWQPTPGPGSAEIC